MKALKNIKNGLMWFVAILLVTGYFYVLFHGLHPDVGWEYKLYYVDKKLEDWPKYGGLAYKLGTEEDFTSKTGIGVIDVKRKGKGWSGEEEKGTWTIGKESFLYYSAIPTSDKSLQINLNICNNMNGVIVDVYANDTFLSSIDDFSQNIHTLHFDTSCLDEGKLTLKFVIKNYTSPFKAGISADDRELGVQVKNISISGENND